MGSCFFFLGFFGKIVVVTNDVGVSADAGTAGDIVFLGVGSTAVGFMVSVFCFLGGEVVPVCPCFGDPFFFQVTSVHPSLLLGWA